MPIDVVGIGRGSEGEGCAIGLVGSEEGVGFFSVVAADEKDHKACCKGIEGACMADRFDVG